jgi:hypothetical protein
VSVALGELLEPPFALGLVTPLDVIDEHIVAFEGVIAERAPERHRRHETYASLADDSRLIAVLDLPVAVEGKMRLQHLTALFTAMLGHRDSFFRMVSSYPLLQVCTRETHVTVEMVHSGTPRRDASLRLPERFSFRSGG